MTFQLFIPERNVLSSLRSGGYIRNEPDKPCKAYRGTNPVRGTEIDRDIVQTLLDGQYLMEAGNDKTMLFVRRPV